MLHRNTGRLLDGFERLRLQGLDMQNMLPSSAMGAARTFSQQQLRNLAGNAFSGPHFAVVLTIALALFEFPKTVEEVQVLKAEAFK